MRICYVYVYMYRIDIRDMINNHTHNQHDEVFFDAFGVSWGYKNHAVRSTNMTRFCHELWVGDDC